MKAMILSLLLAVAGLNADVQPLTTAHQEFAFSLYPILETSDDNLVFSPYSIATCLSMVYVGARGDTATQMEKVLHLNIDRKSLGKAAFSLAQSLQPKKKEENTYQLNLANALWIDQQSFVLADFRYAIEQQFKAKLGILNFSQTANAVATINNWISQQTQGKIDTLLMSNDIDAMTRLVLTNAVYFQGVWNHPFDPKMTRNATFYPTPETTTSVKMMAQVLFAPYYENDLLQAVALSFVGTTTSSGKLALVILLPKSADNFSNMEQALSESFEEWLSALKSERVDLKLPKFQLSARYDLNAPLKQLGMEEAFDSDANFTGIDGLRDLYLNKVVHQTFFDLNENGVTAAAATAASMNTTAIGPQQQPPIPLYVDHPFLFFIIDMNSHEMLFMGKMVEPGA